MVVYSNIPCHHIGFLCVLYTPDFFSRFCSYWQQIIVEPKSRPQFIFVTPQLHQLPNVGANFGFLPLYATEFSMDFFHVDNKLLLDQDLNHNQILSFISYICGPQMAKLPFLCVLYRLYASIYLWARGTVLCFWVVCLSVLMSVHPYETHYSLTLECMTGFPSNWLEVWALRQWCNDENLGFKSQIQAKI